VVRCSATATVAGLPGHIAARELRVIGEMLNLAPAELHLREASAAAGPGNVVMVEVQSEHVTEVFTGFGRRGVPAEKVAAGAAQAARRYLAADVAVADHLADQLLLPMAQAGAGSLTTLPPTPHTTTNRDVIEQFLDTHIEIRRIGDSTWRIAVAGRRERALRAAYHEGGAKT
jgi:RNA 3'-terminal phosphate cyclase (ATP)